MNSVAQQMHQKPQKQGGLYSLNLGQNNGPYLTKDIMLNNPKSQALIKSRNMTSKTSVNLFAQTGQSSIAMSLLSTGRNFQQNALELEEPMDHYDEKLKAYINYDEKYKAKMTSADNLAVNSKFVNEQVTILQRNFQFYKDLIQSYRKDLETMHEEIHNSNMNNIREIQPMLKDFHQRLKDKLYKEKNQHYKLQRELEQLNRDKIQIQQSILFCHKRILDLEKLVGIEHQENEENLNYDQEQEDSQDYEDD